ncbi:TPA: toxin [Salmonella enterica subsp. enterica serovar Reading]|nr:toxin [Salmonella enterica]EBS3610841.1 toxin [Salmonella enterica subsp. enterica serovar Poona]EBU6211245.1 toxin [Salmonella enterica subsp. enterica]EDM1743939.1 toxin [Salmonella enterica subsp. enterica serovar Muenchen]EGB1030954.1 toxin [Salmonella enterica subsp. enterica serovar Reading]EGI5705940.1 toxin [Salmonella enterica subsp. enterica serovar Chester]
MNKKTVITITVMALFVTGCSSKKEMVDPKIFPPISVSGAEFPSPDEPGLPLPGRSPAQPLNAPVPVPDTNTHPAVTLINMDGSALTMWSRSAGASLWAYYIHDSNSFGELRNWEIMPGTRQDTIQFRNVAVGTCMTSFPGLKGGFQLSTAPCEFSPERFDFKLLSTRNGNYQLQSLSTGLCIRAEFLNRTTSSPYATTLSMKRCPSGSEDNYEFLWSVSEPLRPALATIVKPEFRPFPPR